ncbi:uncharacterized protein LOC131667430 isoform X2 [Phymastichus coffea]|uniref:uncharacterized protein LOC131667430 isoform X2 n=1 Tax=Phymastichus coffea TaxID=108790 RepID=UPI00273AA46C|nr:uncharacterized protein LOC131667430 isoform X2 [Phymastichus coffea]
MESAAKGVEWSQEQACRSKLRLVRARRARRLDQAAQGEARGRQAGHSHGLELVASTTLHKAFADVCFCDATQVGPSPGTPPPPPHDHHSARVGVPAAGPGGGGAALLRAGQAAATRLPARALDELRPAALVRRRGPVPGRLRARPAADLAAEPALPRPAPGARRRAARQDRALRAGRQPAGGRERRAGTHLPPRRGARGAERGSCLRRPRLRAQLAAGLLDTAGPGRRSPVKCLTSTQNPMYSTKTTVVSKDNSVRIFSSDGSQLSVQILPEEPLNVVSAAYCGNANRLFTIISEAGEILVSDSSACPMKFKSVFVSSEERITSIVGYEIYEEIRNDDGTSKRNRVFYPVGIRIIAGTDNGKLIVVNSLTGKHESMCWAHRGSVMQLRSSSISHRLVSLGTDKCVKVWHILPELAQPLHLFYDVHFTLRINQVATMGSILCVVNSSKTDNVHQLIMYHMKERERLEHPNTDDHRAPIVDMITSESLKICATSSLDNTIRIWSDDNCLVNVLRLNLCAWSTAFSSVNGDIVFGAGRRLYKIPYENYLTPYYQAKMSTTDLSEDDYDELVAEDSKYRIYDNEINRSAMLHPVNSLLLASIDVFDSKNPQVDLVQKQICELIESRDEDIRNIKNYLVTSSKVITSRALMTAQQWEEYVNDLLSSLTPTVPQLPEFQFKSIVETNSQENKAYNEPAVFHMLFGYSLDNLQYTECLAEKIMNDIFPLHGFLPNSILYKSKEPEIPKVYEKPPKKELVKYKYPVEFFKKSQESILEARKSIRLSQLVLVESKTDEQENA